ncbi:MAG: hypothetical protein KatS3mg033_1685 [Thermonema sp.]|jgi:uncharacterized protein YcbK (DUF882 family)|uniref:hypothetical protein n=1 Tax=Thermonema TaxID=28194 RepID=UPI00056F68BB|nr:MULTISPECIES: hypothetical protein [Thermonema]GIV39885.1 MAG: hypothetical protein KatS3mg033_1685 [Thermonema sp.]
MENTQDYNMGGAQMSSSKLDEIKKIIFGEELETYNNELKKLKNLVESYRTEISVKIDEVKIEMLRSIEKSEERLLNQIQQVQAAMQQELQNQRQRQVSKSALKQIFDQMSNTLGQ